jgi:hypothetical protein
VGDRTDSSLSCDFILVTSPASHSRCKSDTTPQTSEVCNKLPPTLHRSIWYYICPHLFSIKNKRSSNQKGYVWWGMCHTYGTWIMHTILARTPEWKIYHRRCEHQWNDNIKIRLREIGCVYVNWLIFRTISELDYLFTFVDLKMKSFSQKSQRQRMGR